MIMLIYNYITKFKIYYYKSDLNKLTQRKIYK